MKNLSHLLTVALLASLVLEGCIKPTLYSEDAVEEEVLRQVAVSGVIREEFSGDPMAGVNVYLSKVRPGLPSTDSPLAETVTDSAGNYRFLFSTRDVYTTFTVRYFSDPYHAQAPEFRFNFHSLGNDVRKDIDLFTYSVLEVKLTNSTNHDDLKRLNISVNDSTLISCEDSVPFPFKGPGFPEKTIILPYLYQSNSFWFKNSIERHLVVTLQRKNQPEIVKEQRVTCPAGKKTTVSFTF